MVLDKDGAFGTGEWTLDGGGGGEIFREFQIVVDQHAIEFHCDSGPSGPFTLGVECCRGEHDVVGLPAEWWQTHVETWWGDGVDASAFVVFSIEAKGIEYLGFPSAAVIDTAVTSFLTHGGGFVGGKEFEVERVAFKVLFTGAASGKQIAVHYFTFLPMLGSAAIEEDNGSLGWLSPETEAAALYAWEG